ncbi:LysR family transcriptional regulator [Erwiniaceae bacterium BAC15a-03b]|uniref:LysR family transcriptional regulator n=1 Tax=Winslowiella arboricola TaxID=2978220 RepID=A0A9J6Q1C0_9GAMM|nr:LysR family transcriptional regulator [Winslowiella arboricola]MCU5774801.1 LysR family transcriptional regulator [Winslowiella arboricola]MCU5780047.1 LysR family transcriptional regulator [Winslowiella arboricola]
MDLHQLRCFIAVAEELHFGHAAQRLDMMPSALGRYIRLLEEDLGARLFSRSTRNVALTPTGLLLLDEARLLIAQADSLASRFRQMGRHQATMLKIGAIDSAAAGLIPQLLQAFRKQYPEVEVQIFEDKTLRLLPRLKSGRLDLVFIRPPEKPDRDIEMRFLFNEAIVVAVPDNHPLASRQYLQITDLQDQPLIVPERKSRPHSHDLSINLFAEAGLTAKIAQLADEKQTIINLVAAELGIAIVPQWTSRMPARNVSYIPLQGSPGGAINGLPLSVAWMRDARDPLREKMLDLLISPPSVNV